MTPKEKYFGLLSLVCEKLPTSAIDALAKKTDYPLGATALAQVRVGRTINLHALVDLIGVGLPDFEIPEHLRPAEPVLAEAPLFQV
nr:hypothetical protein [Tanacetum cinerariifolium]